MLKSRFLSFARKTMKEILITNDDGYESEGLKNLLRC